jgi:hypothetical protein
MCNKSWADISSVIVYGESNYILVGSNYIVVGSNYIVGSNIVVGLNYIVVGSNYIVGSNSKRVVSPSCDNPPNYLAGFKHYPFPQMLANCVTGWRIRSSNPGRGSFLQNLYTVSGAHLDSYSTGTGRSSSVRG